MPPPSLPCRFTPTTTHELQMLIEGEIARNGDTCDLNHIDVGYITDFRNVFEDSKFNGDISGWDVGRGGDFRRMFACSRFNGDISQWDTSRATNMQQMFAQSKFNGDISQWDVSGVRDMSSMFLNAAFDGDLSHWDVRTDTDVVGSDHGLLALVTHHGGHVRKHLRLPVLSIECFRLFLATPAAMHAWLGERLAQGDMSRYHWDALLRQPDAPWATKEMHRLAQTYVALVSELPPSCIEHSELCMQTWIKSQHGQPDPGDACIALPELEGP